MNPSGCESQSEHAKAVPTCRQLGPVSMLGCQVWLADSRDGGTVWAAGRSLPEMSLAFALMAQSTVPQAPAPSCRTGSNIGTKPYRRLSGGHPRFSFLRGAAQAAREAVAKWPAEQ